MLTICVKFFFLQDFSAIFGFLYARHKRGRIMSWLPSVCLLVCLLSFLARSISVQPLERSFLKLGSNVLLLR